MFSLPHFRRGVLALRVSSELELTRVDHGLAQWSTDDRGPAVCTSLELDVPTLSPAIIIILIKKISSSL